MTPWDYISDTLSQEPSMEEFKKGLSMLTTSGVSYEDMFRQGAEAKQQAQDVAGQYPTPPERGTLGNTRLLGWLANRIGHGIMNPTQTAAKAVETMTPGSEEEAFDTAMNVAPMGVIKPNFRSAQQLQQLRRTMAEEMRSRGPVGQAKMNITEHAPAIEVYPPFGPESHLGYEKYDRTFPYQVGEKEIPDPFDLILRGTPYHGLSYQARDTVADYHKLILSKSQEELQALWNKAPGQYALNLANETGFPNSLHNSQSISNKWGEPAGVSTSFLPTKSGTQFSPDEYIHRLLPLYGGPPTERTVNLMLPEGRETLRNAYSGALGKFFEENPETTERITRHFRESVDNPLYPNPLKRYIGEANESRFLTGKFNQGLSNKLQGMGKRAILYNPQRYDEYEMLMLDPKYALPIDYRMFQEYANPAFSRANRAYESIRSLDEAAATPGVRRGLEQIKEIMSQNHSRLGDIYSERPWQGYINEPTKESILQRIGPDYREQVGNMLNDLRHRNIDILY